VDLEADLHDPTVKGKTLMVGQGLKRPC